ncbi:MAG: DJ-1/PfpI family protein [Spirochaetes bacterium]|nr:DJ-1/PfpI family protein [Spirochaetota bacterium]
MKNVLLLLAKGFEEYEAGIFATVMGWSTLYGDEKIGITTASLHKEIASANNIIVKPALFAWNIKTSKYTALVVPGGNEVFDYFDDAYSTHFLNVIRDFHQEDKPIATVSLGALPLAKSGILYGRKATTLPYLNGIHVKQLRALGAVVEHQRIVVDDNIITSATPETAVDVALLLLKMITSTNNSNQIKKMLGLTELKKRKF